MGHIINPLQHTTVLKKKKKGRVGLCTFSLTPSLGVLYFNSFSVHLLYNVLIRPTFVRVYSTFCLNLRRPCLWICPGCYFFCFFFSPCPSSGFFHLHGTAANWSQMFWSRSQIWAVFVTRIMLLPLRSAGSSVSSRPPLCAVALEIPSVSDPVSFENMRISEKLRFPLTANGLPVGLESRSYNTIGIHFSYKQERFMNMVPTLLHARTFFTQEKREKPDRDL